MGDMNDFSRWKQEWQESNVAIAEEGPPPCLAAEIKPPICTGVLDYFPLAIAEVARVSLSGNDQHNPGEELHWDRSKSMDQLNAAVRHIMLHGTIDDDGLRHMAKAAWRCLAELELELEKG